jgi:hypothetical protein
MSLTNPELPQFSVHIICPKCAAVGVVVWERDAAQNSLVSLSRGFYERISKKHPYSIELVCHECGTAQPEG